LTVDAELDAMAAEELERACTLSWRDLNKVVPWGDSSEAFAPSGRPVMVDRAYLWASEPGEDILVEVVVYPGAALYDQGQRRSQRLSRPGR